MPSPHDLIADHSLREVARNIRESIDGKEQEVRDALNAYEPLNTVDRAAATAAWIEGLLDIVDPLLVPSTALDAMVGPLSMALRSLHASWSSPTDIANVAVYLDQLFANAGPLVVATPAVRETASQVARGFGVALGHRTRALKSDVDQLFETLYRAKEELDDLRETTTVAEDQRSRSLSARADQLSATFDQLQARVDQMVAAHEEAFQAQEARRARLFDDQETQRAADAHEVSDERTAAFDAFLEDGRSQLAASLDEIEHRAAAQARQQEAEASGSLGHIEDVRAKVDSLYSIISNKGTAGAFHDEATAERKAANTWRAIAVVLGVAAIAAAMMSAFVIRADDTNWPHLIAKLAVTLAFAGIATYAGQQSARHRNREEQAKQLELDLTAIGPFIENMPDDDQEMRNVVRGQFVDRWMASRTNAGQSDGKSVPINVPLDRLVAALLPDADTKK